MQRAPVRHTAVDVTKSALESLRFRISTEQEAGRTKKGLPAVLLGEELSGAGNLLEGIAGAEG